MTVADVLRAVRARWLLFSVCCLVPLAAAFAAGRASAPVYSATAGLFVAPARQAEGVDAYQNAFSAAQLAEQQAPSFASMADSPVVLRAVIADLHLATTPSHLSGQVSATSPTNSVVINITAHAGSAAVARDIANDTARRFAGLAERVLGSIRGDVSARPPQGGGPVNGGPADQADRGEPRAAAHRAELLAQDHRSGPRACGRAGCWADSGDSAGEDGPEGADRRRGPIEHRMQLGHKCRRHGGAGRSRSSAGRGCPSIPRTPARRWPSCSAGFASGWFPP